MDEEMKKILKEDKNSGKKLEERYQTDKNREELGEVGAILKSIHRKTIKHGIITGINVLAIGAVVFGAGYKLYDIKNSITVSVEKEKDKDASTDMVYSRSREKEALGNDVTVYKEWNDWVLEGPYVIGERPHNTDTKQYKVIVNNKDYSGSTFPTNETGVATLLLSRTRTVAEQAYTAWEPWEVVGEFAGNQLPPRTDTLDYQIIDVVKVKTNVYLTTDGTYIELKPEKEVGKSR